MTTSEPLFLLIISVWYRARAGLDAATNFGNNRMGNPSGGAGSPDRR
jgi:hypothetical protein